MRMFNSDSESERTAHLHRQISELTAEVQDWRDSAKAAASERCEDASAVHCTCVGPLRKRARDLEARLAVWSDAAREAFACDEGAPVDPSDIARLVQAMQVERDVLIAELLVARKGAEK